MASPLHDTPAPKPTARDVASLAEVSVATVSYVLNGRLDRRVGDATRQRVMAAAAQLDYVPNHAAQSLKRRRTERVCLVVGSIGVPFYDKLAADLHRVADEYGYGVMTVVVDSDERARKTIESLRQGVADAALIATGDRIFPELRLESLARSGFPVTVVGNHLEADGFDVVRAPEFDACTMALDHLVSRGKRRIGFIGHNGDFEGEHSERFAAYRSALARHGLDSDPALVASGADTRVAGYRAAVRMLGIATRPDALFVASDRAAVSAIWAARDSRLRVPEDVAVVGCGNIPDGLIVTPALTTVGLPRMDYVPAARLLFERLRRRERLPARTLTTSWTFIRRGSA